MLEVGRDARLVDTLARTFERDPQVRAEVTALLEENETVEPSSEQLTKIAIAAAVPFFGFGVMDNAIMIALGEVIDTTLCVKLGFSTMSAAALGNTFSDAIGVYSGGVIEDMARKAGFEEPPLSHAQAALAVTKRWERVGQCSGIVVGCLVGMFPLLVFDAQAGERIRREKAMDDMFDEVVERVAKMVDCEFANLMLVDSTASELYTRSGTTYLHGPRVAKARFKIDDGSVASQAVTTGNLYNLEDVVNTEFYIPHIHDNFRGTGRPVQSMLCMPIRGFDQETKESKVIGVLQLTNKRGGKFTDKDEDVMAALCSHISTSLGAAEGKEQTFSQTLDTLESALKTRGVRINLAQNRRVEGAYKQLMTDMTSMFDAAATQLLVCDQSGSLVLKSSDKIPSFRREPRSLGITGKVFAERKTMVVNDVPNSPYYNKDRHSNYMGTGIKVQAVLAAPVIATDGEALGVLACMRDSTVPFSPEDVRILNSVAGTIALNLEGAGASLSRVLQQVKRQQASAQGSETFDCSAEVLQVVQAALLLVQKGGGHVDRARLGEFVAEQASTITASQ